MITVTDAQARSARIAARAEAIDAHSDGIAAPGRNPITGEATVSQPAHSIARGIDGVEGFAALGQVASLRGKIESIKGRAPQGADNRILTDDEVQGLALRAIAALGRTADVKRGRAGDYRPAYLRLVAAEPGGPRDFHPVGPYVSDAVRWVLDGIAYSGADHDLVQTYAALHNIVARGI